MKLLINLPASALEDRFSITEGVRSILEMYKDQVLGACFSLQPTIEKSLTYDCQIRLNVRWWGKMSVDIRDADPRRAVDLALGQLEGLLDALLGDLVTVHSVAV